MTAIDTDEQYRFEHGHIFRLEHDSFGRPFYLYCYQQTGCNTKQQAISEYESKSDQRMLDEMYPDNG